MDEALRMSLVGREQGVLAGLQRLRGPAVVDVGRGEGGDAAVPVLVVVPVEEEPAEGVRVLEGGEAIRELRPVLERLELALGEGVVVGNMGPAVAALTLRSTRNWESSLEVIGEPRSAWTVRSPFAIPCLEKASRRSLWARALSSRSASIHPTT